MKRALHAVAALAVLAGASTDRTAAQSAGTNPDISVIPSFIVCPSDAEDCAYTEADGSLELQEVELAL